VKKIFFLLGWVAFLFIGNVGCGPVESTAVILSADTALHNAKTADGDQKSPYEYTAAEQYLHKAREKWGTSDFEYSVDYATKARDLATTARERSLKKEDQ
jgi:hypothetical protein